MLGRRRGRRLILNDIHERLVRPERLLSDHGNVVCEVGKDGGDEAGGKREQDILREVEEFGKPE